MGHGEEPGEELPARPASRAGSDPLQNASDADIQEQERSWAAGDDEAEPEEPNHLGLEKPEADALEQARDWGSGDDESEFPHG